jgi:hypothetical protein
MPSFSITAQPPGCPMMDAPRIAASFNHAFGHRRINRLGGHALPQCGYKQTLTALCRFVDKSAITIQWYDSVTQHKTQAYEAAKAKLRMLPQVLMWVGDVLTAIENTFDLLCAKPPFKSAQDHQY